MSHLKLTVARGLLAAASLAIFGLIGAGSAHAAVGGTVDVHASITLEPAFPIFESAPLVFGSAVISKDSGIISMKTDSDTVTFSGGVTSVNQTTAHRGSFQFIAPQIGTYQVTIPANTQMANVNDPTKTINLAPAVSVRNPVTTEDNQAVDVYVAGTITLGAGTPRGGYAGVVTVTVNSM